MSPVRIEDLEVPDGSTHLLNGTPFTGVAIALSDEGWVEEELSFVDGIQTGPMRSYDRYGRMCDEEFQRGGVPHGARRQWHPTGRLAAHEVYEFGVLLEATYWDDSGSVVRAFALDSSDPAWETIRRYRALCLEPRAGPQRS